MAKSSERIQADKSSAVRPSATVSDVNTSDIYALMKGVGSAAQMSQGFFDIEQSSEAQNLNEGIDGSYTSYDRRSKRMQKEQVSKVKSFASKLP